MKEMKSEIDEKNEEINRLKEKLSITTHTLKAKDNEIQAMQ